MELLATGRFWISALMTALAAYLIGSVSFAVIISRLCAQDDVRSHGSGNAGMTNILRTYGKKLAVLTALGDFGKGVVAVALGRLIFHLAAGGADAPAIYNAFDGGYIAGLFVIIGHVFPLYFQFKGGKGVLTSLGVVTVLNPLVFSIIVLLMIPFVFIVKIVSLASVIGFMLFPIATTVVNLLSNEPFLFDLIFSLLISGIGIWMHRSNIKRLLNGTEYKFGGKKNP